ncbi:hypothetical protein GF312_10180 [Candidatus Poribacteria bacterium]|nr:hypothetical protein [Candidatus Poribacteria bacterium]
MQRLIMIFSPILLVVFLLISGNSYALDVGADAIVGVWLFDEDPNDSVKDSSGNGNDGQIMGDVEWVDDARFGKALLFPGVDENYVEIPHNDSLDLTTFSFTAWIKIEQGASYQSIIIKTADGAVENYAGYIFDGTGVFWTRFTSGGAGQWGFQQWGAVPATDGEWHHIAGTYDKEKVISYIDGTIEAEPEFDGDPDFNPGPLNIGDCPGYPYAVNGIIDDIGLFNVGLTQDEVIDIMENGLASTLAVEPSGKLAIAWGGIKK